MSEEILGTLAWMVMKEPLVGRVFLVNKEIQELKDHRVQLETKESRVKQE